MNKYRELFKISLTQEFAYRLNFIMWRVRNMLQIILTYFLWTTVFADPARVVFGYNREKILTYVFGVLFLKAIVLSARTVDIAGDIETGAITNLILKPISFLKYWFTRDLASKFLNLGFSGMEMLFFALVFQPRLFWQTDAMQLLGFFLSLILAVVIFFSVLLLVNLIAFWMPEAGWAAQFLFIVILTEFLAGGIFPLDIFPGPVFSFLYFLPFPYLIFFPLKVYLGQITGMALFKGLLISGGWALILLVTAKSVWLKGVKKYSAEGM